MEVQKRSAATLKERRVPLPWPERRTFRILSIDGGGICGIFPAAFLAALEDRYLRGSSIAGYFDLIAGTSTGGILALGLASGFSASMLKDLYVQRGCEIFPPIRSGIPGRWLQAFGRYFRYRYDRDALMRILDETLRDRTLEQAESRLCIPSFDGRHGEVYVFKTPHHPDFIMDGKEPMTKVAAATAAAPTYFRPLQDGGYTFVDGGVWANNPVMIALVDALTCFDVARDRIRVLSLGCGGEPYTVGGWKVSMGGLFAWRDIIRASMSLQSQNALGQAGLLIGADRIVRVVPELAHEIDLDDWSRASTELPPIAQTAADRDGGYVARKFLEDAVEANRTARGCLA